MLAASAVLAMALCLPLGVWTWQVPRNQKPGSTRGKGNFFGGGGIQPSHSRAVEHFNYMYII